MIGGAIAEQYLIKNCGNCFCVAWVSRVGPHTMYPMDHMDIMYPDLEKAHYSCSTLRKEIDASLVRCPDPKASISMIGAIETARAQGDSVGGIVEACIFNPPIGLGEPCFDKIEAKLAHAMMSIPATKGFEIGRGFLCSEMRGSEHNDTFASGGEGLHRNSTDYQSCRGDSWRNTSGTDIRFRVAFKPPSTISQQQTTVTLSGDPTTLEAKGRHDPCVVHRAVPIVEAMASIVLLDAVLQQRRLGV